MTPSSPRNVLELADTLSFDEVNEHFHQAGMTDGLPIIPPTAELVGAMVAASGRRADAALGKIPPRDGIATIEALAANAVMAGCRPAQMPLFLAAVEAILDERFNLYGVQATTSPAHPGFLVNGPIRTELGINCDYGCLGPGPSSRVNLSIGRAIRLAMLNLGGAAPGDLDRSTHGTPGKLSLVFGENEEASPWEPLHVEYGFERENSVVTAFGATSVLNVHDNTSKVGEELLTTIAHSLTAIGTSNLYWGRWFSIALSTDNAATIAAAGFSKRDVRQFLFENSFVPLTLLPKGLRDAIVQMRSGDAGLTDTRISPMQSPDSLGVVVAGGHGKHIAIIHTSVAEDRVSKLVRRG